MEPRMPWWQLVLGGVVGALYLYGLLWALLVIGLAFE